LIQEEVREVANDVRQYKVTLTTIEPFRIGALQNVLSGLDNPVATVGGRVVVQGSTLKGALRAEIERHLIENYASDDAMRPCIPSSVNTLSPEELKLIEKGVYRRDGGCVYSMRRKSESICPACYLLGAQGLPGFVRVPYLFTETPAEELYSVRVDRGTGVVAERTNRDYQIMPDHTVFEGILEVLFTDAGRQWKLGERRFNEDKWVGSGKWDAGKIIDEFVIARLHAISVVGGFKSKGCGKVSIEVEQIVGAASG
jgi:CRISPR/Cas system CSM-associated protein Csm3 (group 7 of RAMP superfamily)